MTVPQQHVPSESLSAWLDGELTPDETSQIQTHLESCPECRREADELRATVNLLQGLPEIRSPRSFQLGPEHRRPVQIISPAVKLIPLFRSLSVAAVLIFMIAGSARLIDVANNNDTGPTLSQPTETVENPQASGDAGNGEGQTGSLTERGEAASNGEEGLLDLPSAAPTDGNAADTIQATAANDDADGRSVLATIAISAGLVALALVAVWFVLFRMAKSESVRWN